MNPPNMILGVSFGTDLWTKNGSQISFELGSKVEQNSCYNFNGNSDVAQKTGFPHIKPYFGGPGLFYLLDFFGVIIHDD